MEKWFIISAVLLFFVLICINNIRTNKKIRKHILSHFGTNPYKKDFDISDVDSYHMYTNMFRETKEHIDDITWNDLNMDDVYKRINNCHTTIGEEYLYQKLHKLSLTYDNEDFIKLLNYLKNNQDERVELQMTMSKLGKSRHSLSLFIFNAKNNKTRFPGFVYIMLSCSATMLIILTIISSILLSGLSVAFLTLCVMSIVVNAIIFYNTKLKLDNQLETLSHFSHALSLCEKIMKTDHKEMNEYFLRIKNDCRSYKFIKGIMSSQSNNLLSEFRFLLDYINMIFFIDIIKYNKAIKKIINNSQSIDNIFRFIGEIDMAISILSFRKSLDYYCEPTISETNIIEFEEMYHPLVYEPVMNSEIININMIITGPNASGKSTFIKATAINNILALTINTCCAKKYHLMRALVISSMALRDDIIKGESYYITEVKSLKRILDKMEEIPCTCYIDEILRGTNTIERIASSVAVLEYISKKDSLCIIATHDSELAQLLDNKYSNYHFSESIKEDEIEFDYILKKGMAMSKNAIKLLKIFEYNEDIITKANSMVREYESTDKWTV